MPRPYVVVDAFADEPFAGNPAAVVVLEGPAEEGWMKKVAREMNLSETAFLFPMRGGWRLRWLTPVVEVDLCGHATLAAAHVLWEEGRLALDERAAFETRSGTLYAARDGELIVLDFPATPPEPAEAPPGLAEALGVAPVSTSRSRFDLLVELPSEEAVRGLAPDLDALARLPVRGVIVTARAAKPFDFVSRFFAPAAGVPEDPVTGSAHCALAPFWRARLHRSELLAWQASPRGGRVRVTNSADRVLLAGSAITVARGELVYDWGPAT